MKKEKTLTQKVENDEKITLKSIILWIGIYALIFLVCFLGSMLFVRGLDNGYRYYPVKGTSMQPTINEGTVDREEVKNGVFVKVTKQVEKNDIVIIQKNPDDDYTIIKRVLGTGGDRVTIVLNTFEQGNADYSPAYRVLRQKKGESEIEVVDETAYLDPNDQRFWINSSSRSPVYANSAYNVGNYQYDKLFYNKFFGNVNDSHIVKLEYEGKLMLFVELEDDQVFYLGDHRSVSADARENGMARRSQIVGKVISIVDDAKLNEEGKLWWVKLRTIFSYYWSNIVDYFART